MPIFTLHIYTCTWASKIRGSKVAILEPPHTLLFLHLVILVTSLDLFASIVDVITRDPFIYFFIIRLFICWFFLFLLLCIKSGNKTALNLPYPQCSFQTKTTTRLFRFLSAIELGGTKYVNLYDPITLTCNATFGRDALSSAQVDWFHNGQIIKSSDSHWSNRLRIAQYITSDGRTIVSELRITHSVHEDDGRYVCRTTNYVNDRQETDSIDVIVLTSKYPKKNGSIGI